jgi:predicted MarR family transcription regulator
MASGKKSGIGPIVSSAHLADNAAPELSELEFALTIANNAFQRWIVRGTTAVGMGELGALDVLVLHTVNHRGRPKKLADICLVLNQEDTHVVAYALKKLEKLGLVESARQGKEKYASTTQAGTALCERYREIREACLIGAVESMAEKSGISELARLLRALSGLYDQAARAATAL